jgi:hypothetical protein
MEALAPESHPYAERMVAIFYSKLTFELVSETVHAGVGNNGLFPFPNKVISTC